MDNVSSEILQLNVEFSDSDATLEDIDRMTRQLLSELRGLNVESVKLVKGDSLPTGAKGDPAIIGSIVLEILPDLVPIAFSLVQTWALRRRGRTVKIKSTDLVFEGSPEEFQQFLATREKGKKKK
jgi:hypothetical protein